MPQIRLLEADDLERLGWIRGECYGNGHPMPVEPGELERSQRQNVVLVDEHGLQAAYRILAETLFFGPHNLPMGGIAGVVTAPQARGRGYAALMMADSLTRMREMGLSVSALYPFRFRYYRKFGWEWVGAAFEQKIPFSLLPKPRSTEYVREATDADLAAMDDVYERYARRFHGCIKRDREFWWKRRLADTHNGKLMRYLVEKDGAVQGYLLFPLEPGDTLQVRELVALNVWAFKELLSFCTLMDMRYTHVLIDGPQNNPARLLFSEWEIKTQVEPVFQARVVDVGAAFSQRTTSSEGRFVLQVRDETADWNDGTWSVEFGPGGVEAARSGQTPGVALSIQALSQAFFGYPTVDALRGADLLEVSDEAQYESFRALLRPHPVWTLDPF